MHGMWDLLLTDQSFVWLPLEKPSTEFSTEVLQGGGVTAFIGATIFEIGSVFLFIEAVNENREGCFGWAIEQMLEGPQKQWRLIPDENACRHHHRNRGNLVGKHSESREVDHSSSHAATDLEGPSTSPSKETEQSKSWTWIPGWYDFRTHYIRELGFLACSAQLFAATIFWISGFTALPGIYDELSEAALKGAYLAPQVIGGFGFVVSGVLFMLETQRKWYLPALRTLGWHIGFWNTVGGLGFFLCPIFGFYSSLAFQESLSTFWGSWAFLIGSLIQLYESLQKNPVDIKGP